MTWASMTGAGAAARPTCSATRLRSRSDAPQPPRASVDAHDHGAGVEQRPPEDLVEPERLRRPHLLGRRGLGQEGGEGGDELLLLVAEAQVHGGRE